jgi:hypothetical protein
MAAVPIRKSYEDTRMCLLCNNKRQIKQLKKIAHELGDIKEALWAINHSIQNLDPEAKAVSLIFWEVHPDGTRSKIEMAFTLTDVQQVTLAITAVDARGNPAKLDGAPVWASSDTALLTIAPAADGLSCVATAVGPLGTAQITVTADADLGAGVRELQGLLDIEIIASEALNVTIVPGTPVAV